MNPKLTPVPEAIEQLQRQLDQFRNTHVDSDEGNRVFRSDVDKDQSSAKLAISLLMDYRHESREDSGQVVLFRFHCGS